jgi:glycosyltransferase involved in cell wall biosynthesis
MMFGKRIVVVLPAYQAERTLADTHAAIPHDVVDRVLLVDDASSDGTVATALRLGIDTFVHARNLGYGANQKTCYREALAQGADVVIMVHPDYQYEPRLIAAMAAMVASGVYDLVLGSRILGSGSPLHGGMPRYKYVANRLLTLVQNMMLGSKLSEFHTGFRGFSRRVLETLPLGGNSNDFAFDNEMLVQAVAAGFASCRVRRGMRRNPAPSASAVRSCTASPCSGRARPTACGGGGCSAVASSTPAAPWGPIRAITGAPPRGRATTRPGRTQGRRG